MKHLGVLASGGDAPGMNAAIRAVTREALARGISVTGFSEGYAGVLEWKAIELTARAVGGIIHQGGTLLGSGRCQNFCTESGLEQAIRNLHAHRIEGEILIALPGQQGRLRPAADCDRGFGLERCPRLYSLFKELATDGSVSTSQALQRRLHRNANSYSGIRRQRPNSRLAAISVETRA